MQPRTAIGIDRTGRQLLLLVIDGRRDDYSVGATHAELAEELIRLGAWDAVNLDGGGSSTMVMFNPALVLPSRDEIKKAGDPKDLGSRFSGDPIAMSPHAHVKPGLPPAIIFHGKAECATCHIPPTYTDVSSGPDPNVPVLHDPDEIGAERFYAERSATKEYRTSPLRGIWQHPPYFHDGSAATLLAVVNHYDEVFKLNLSPSQKADLVEFLKSL